ncbi:hypothetical protein [Rhizobium sp. BR 362]|uniref:hypothetical protein n=1 Tax=Rhizobium sp. BR 362 TaxID=3040670 RepID=UPI002F4192ED
MNVFPIALGFRIEFVHAVNATSFALFTQHESCDRRCGMAPLKSMQRELQISGEADSRKSDYDDGMRETLADGRKCQTEQDNHSSQQKSFIGDREGEGGHANGSGDNRYRHLVLKTLGSAREREQEPVPAQSKRNAQKQGGENMPHEISPLLVSSLEKQSMCQWRETPVCKGKWDAAMYHCLFEGLPAFMFGIPIEVIAGIKAHRYRTAVCVTTTSMGMS